MRPVHPRRESGTVSGAELGCSAIEAPFVGVHGKPDLLFGPSDNRIEDVAIIHTPGHTDGSICFFYRSPHGKSYLFSGDTIFQWDGEWSTLVLPQSGGSAADLGSKPVEAPGDRSGHRDEQRFRRRGGVPGGDAGGVGERAQRPDRRPRCCPVKRPNAGCRGSPGGCLRVEGCDACRLVYRHLESVECKGWDRRARRCSSGSATIPRSPSWNSPAATCGR